jgi:NTE family protein
VVSAHHRCLFGTRLLARPRRDRGDRVSGGELRADLVFEGGGVKGIALAGAYRELEERGYQPQCVAGTSTGAIIAAFTAVGYSAAEIEQLAVHDLRFTDFADPTFLGHFGKPGAASEFLLRGGMHSGKRFLAWMQEALAAKGKMRFGDLRDDAAPRESRRYRLQVIASDLSERRMLVLPRDAALIGIEDPDELEIALAVRMSTSIPVFFDPVIFHNARTGRDHVIVDGALLSNFPIWLFDVPPGLVPEFPTFGMNLVRPDQRDAVLPAHAPRGIAADLAADLAYLKAIVETMMEAHDRRALDQGTHARTIALPTMGVGAVDFAIDDEQRRALHRAGRSATAAFLDRWDFEAYVEEFRRGSGARA